MWSINVFLRLLKAVDFVAVFVVVDVVVVVIVNDVVVTLRMFLTPSLSKAFEGLKSSPDKCYCDAALSRLVS